MTALLLYMLVHGSGRLTQALGVIMEQAEVWEPVTDISEPFGSISYSYDGESLLVTLHGTKSLSLRFDGVVAVRCELECPGLDSLPPQLPPLRQSVTFPLLKVAQSRWLSQFEHIYPSRVHFALISSDVLLQLIASPQPVAAWQQ